MQLPDPRQYLDIEAFWSQFSEPNTDTETAYGRLVDSLKNPYDLVSDHLSIYNVLGYDGSLWYVYLDVVECLGGSPTPRYEKIELKQVPASTVHHAVKLGLIEFFGPHIKCAKEFKIQKALGTMQCRRMARLTELGKKYHDQRRSKIPDSNMDFSDPPDYHYYIGNNSGGYKATL